jgi:N-acetylglutamate synthase-like GNAT family acetyltransferase
METFIFVTCIITMVLGYKNDALCQKVLANASAFNTMSKDKSTLSRIFACELNATLKKKLLEYLSDTSLKLQFGLRDLPSKPGVWDEDIIQKLFESKFVNIRYMSSMDWFKTWRYHRNGTKFYRKIINKHAHPQHKKNMNTLLNWSQKYTALYAKKSLPLAGDWHVDIFDGDYYSLDNTVSLKMPSVKISRNRINKYLGSKYYPAISISIHPPTKSNFTSKKNEMIVALDAALQSCTYRNNLLRTNHIAVAKKNGIVVGGFSFEQRKQSLHIEYLCSSKRVYNIGSVLMYAAEEYARFVGLKRVYMMAASNAKPFYFRVGYNYLSNETNMSSLQSYTGSDAKNSNNSNNSNNTATSKRLLHFPTGTNAKMRKYV